MATGVLLGMCEGSESTNEAVDGMEATEAEPERPTHRRHEGQRPVTSEISNVDAPAWMRLEDERSLAVVSAHSGTAESSGWRTRRERAPSFNNVNLFPDRCAL